MTAPLFPTDPDLADDVREFIERKRCTCDGCNRPGLLARWDAAVAATTAPETDDNVTIPRALWRRIRNDVAQAYVVVPPDSALERRMYALLEAMDPQEDVVTR